MYCQLNKQVCASDTWDQVIRIAVNSNIAVHFCLCYFIISLAAVACLPTNHPNICDPGLQVDTHIHTEGITSPMSSIIVVLSDPFGSNFVIPFSGQQTGAGKHYKQKQTGTHSCSSSIQSRKGHILARPCSYTSTITTNTSKVCMCCVDAKRNTHTRPRKWRYMLENSPEAGTLCFMLRLMFEGNAVRQYSLWHTKFHPLPNHTGRRWRWCFSQNSHTLATYISKGDVTAKSPSALVRYCLPYNP